MNHYPPSILKLIKNFSRLPGIGEKTAERLAMHILRASSQEADELSLSIKEIKEKIRLCSRCFGLSDSDVCSICRDHTRNDSVLQRPSGGF